MLWNVFCKVIDNHGDIGVCWRLGADLAARGQQVRLWVDDGSALRWMAPQGLAGVDVRPWTDATPFVDADSGDVLIEAFGCTVPAAFVAVHARMKAPAGRQAVWINLEYLSAQAGTRRNHGLASPVQTGPGAGLPKYFYYPGFEAGTGGLLREQDLLERQAAFDPEQWLQHIGIAPHRARRCSLFCYEPPALELLLQQLAAQAEPTRLLVTAGRASVAVAARMSSLDRLNPSWNRREALSLVHLPLLTQRDFDHLLWACDLNFVRGEDSMVRALWANRPLVWQVYAQSDNAHHAKLQAWLDMCEAPSSLRSFHLRWNSVEDGLLPALDLPQWAASTTRLRGRLLSQSDLCTGLLRFVAEKS